MQRSDWDPDWPRLKEICDAASRLPVSERSVFVADACLEDPALISEVNSLLALREKPNNGHGCPVDKLIGTTIDDRYFVERELDAGAMGRVYLALDRRLDNRPVVVKVLLEASLKKPDVVQRFKQEAVALSRIDHRGVVGVLDAGELNDGPCYIVMQYVDGENLRRQISHEGMDLERVAGIVTQIGDALQHVHDKRIFHRDLKPDNIVVECATESVKIVDFGVAKVTDSAVLGTNADHGLIGTIAYMSPERLRGEPSTAASDIYSLAVIVYEMITGDRPFNANSPEQLLSMQRAGVRVMPRCFRPGVSPKAQSILVRALSFKPGARLESAKEFGDALARALLGPHVEGSSRKRLAVIALVLAVVSLGIFLSIHRPPEVIAGHVLTYSLTVQRTHDGIDYQEPFRSFGEETFENGDKFRLNVSSREPGYLYIFNEGPPEPSNSSFKIIYPNNLTNSGSANIGANQPVQSDWITFRGPAGSENFWIVWSVSPVNELEAAKTEAFKRPDGALTEPSLVGVEQFLRAKQAEIKVKTMRYKSNQTALVRTASEMLITFVEFKHR